MCVGNCRFKSQDIKPISIFPSGSKSNLVPTSPSHRLQQNPLVKWEEIKCPPSPTNFERFIQSIESKTNHEPDFKRGAEIQQILDKCYESSDSGKWLDI